MVLLTDTATSVITEAAEEESVSSITTVLESTAENVVSEVKDVIKPNVITQFMNELPAKALSIGIRVVLAILVLLIGTWLIKLIRKIIQKSMKRAGAEAGVMQFVDSFVKAALNVLLIFFLASYFGVQTASIVALLGSAGVAIGLAVQGSLSNLAGGVLILLLKPFTVGDYIIDGGSGKEGTVTEIQIFHTKLRTLDNKIVILPNGSLANSAITNVTHEDTRRLDINIGISYGADIKKAKDVLEKVLNDDPSVIKEKEHRVVVDALGNSSVDLIVRFWVKGTDYWNSKYRITEHCKLALDENGVEIPFPQVDVHMK